MFEKIELIRDYFAKRFCFFVETTGVLEHLIRCDLRLLNVEENKIEISQKYTNFFEIPYNTELENFAKEYCFFTKETREILGNYTLFEQIAIVNRVLFEYVVEGDKLFIAL